MALRRKATYRAGKPWVKGNTVFVNIYSDRPYSEMAKGIWKIRLSNSKSNWTGKAHGR